MKVPEFGDIPAWIWHCRTLSGLLVASVQEAAFCRGGAGLIPKGLDQGDTTHPSAVSSLHLFPVSSTAARLQEGLRFISALPSYIPLGALKQEPAAPRTFHVTPGAFLS